jgi:DNA-binding GntR family transcriptional regulator
MVSDRSDRTEESATLRGQAVSRLRDDIVSGALQPGLIIRDAELAAHLGISTIPVREALVQLAAEGLIDMPPNRAKRIAPLSKRTLVEMHAVFLVLAMQGFDWGIRKLRHEDVQALDDILRRQGAAINAKEWVSAVRASTEFNAVVYRAADNLELCRLLDRMNAAFARVSILLRPTRDRRLHHVVYKKILAALKRRAWREASGLYRHMLGELSALIELLPEENVMVQKAVSAAPPGRRRPRTA